MSATKNLNRVLARCADYNGHKDVLFMIERNDMEERNKLIPGKWTMIEPISKVWLFEPVVETESGKMYHVYEDWSVKQIQKR